jgi:hypothetical protein
MAFSDTVVERLLVACHRHCCICHKFCGNKIEIHHIIPQAQDGPDTEENGIPLCLDCHAEVEAYNIQHPRGRKFTSSELKKHKQQWFTICATPPWHTSRGASLTFSSEPVTIDNTLFEELVLWEPRWVPSEILEEMSVNGTFAVRSSAAICYYYLAAIEPAAVPLDGGS